MLLMLTGAATLGCEVIALFFLKFWVRTRDRFFLYFALAFFLEGATRAYVTVSEAHGPTPYFARLAAYAFILIAIWEKNRR